MCSQTSSGRFHSIADTLTLSLSLTLTHMHTHTQTDTFDFASLQSFNIHLNRHKITELWLLYSKGMCFPWNARGKYYTYITDITEIDTGEAKEQNQLGRVKLSTVCTVFHSLKWWTLLCPTAFHICLYSNSQNCIFFLLKENSQTFP